MPSIRIVQGQESGQAYPLDALPVTIGRDEVSTIRIADLMASRCHAQVALVGGAFELADQDSLNGTWIGQERITRRHLTHGTAFSIGGTHFVFDEAGLAAPPAQEALQGLTRAAAAETLGSSIIDLTRINRYLRVLHDVVVRSRALSGADALFAMLDEACAEWLGQDRLAIFQEGADGLRLWPPLVARLGVRFGAVPFATRLLDAVSSRQEPLMCGAGGDVPRSESMHLSGLACAMAAPLRCGAQRHAVVYVDRCGGRLAFTQEELALLAALVDLLGMRLHDASAAVRPAERAPAPVRAGRAPPALIGGCAALQRLAHQVERLADAAGPVLISGEPGTGRSHLARCLFAGATALNRICHTVVCTPHGAGDLLARLFGTWPSGPHPGQPGLLELADGGCLLLEDVEALPLEVQGRLVRLLDLGTLQRLGQPGTLAVRVRLLTTTSADLEAAVTAGTFLPELLRRLSATTLALPPLRERGADLPLLCAHFLEAAAARTGRPAPRLAPAALAALAGHRWPGNVRELLAAIEQGVRSGGGAELGVADLPDGFQPAAHAAATPLISLAALERQHILRVLAHFQGNKKAAAEALGIERSTLYARLRLYGEAP